ncbi:MAG: class I SAM-dependent DNA methyltransferase [Candidatus Nanopelagicaceae bacterium]
MEFGLNDAYSLKTPEDNKQLYAKWAATYESEFVANQGYKHPQVISEFFHQYIPEVRRVIDIGTGTGLVGKFLKELRPEIVLDGIDISPEMLAEASKKGIYRNLYERDLTIPVMDIDAPYDALITIGTFTYGHLGIQVLDNLIPLVVKDGYFVIAVNEKYFHEHNFLDKILTKNVKLIHMDKVHVYDEKSDHHHSMNVVMIFQ